jgi:peptidoglycan/xylan/chitin deacetylase (PgdA/CDA1 family)
VVHRAPGAPAAVALTFDDGPSEWTAAIADALEAHGCRGTFFVLGPAVERHPEVVARLAAAGHEVGNHLWSHADPLEQEPGEIRAELDRTAQAVGAATGARPRLVRPPYCGAPGKVARAASRGGADLVVIRSVDPEDWRAASAREIVERVLERVGAGDIVCLHDGVAPGNRGTPSRAPTAEAVARLVPALLERGLRPVTVSELLA